MRKFTLLVALLFCTIGFSQSSAVQAAADGASTSTKAVQQIERSQPSAEVRAILDRISEVGTIPTSDNTVVLTETEAAVLADYYGQNNRNFAPGDVFVNNLRASCGEEFGIFPVGGPYTIAPITVITDGLFAGDFDGAGTLYALNFDTLNLDIVDTTTGAQTPVGPLTNLVGTPSGLAWNEADGTMYAASTDGVVSTIYSIDLTTGTCTVIGNTGNTLGIWLAIDPAGNAFMADIGDDNLYSIDLGTGAGTVVGPLGIDISFAQDADFDPDSGILYMGAYIGGGVNFFASVDTATGAATTLGSINADCCEAGIIAIEGTPGGGGGGGGTADNVLYLNADNDPLWSGDVVAKLLAEGIPVVDEFDSFSGTPTLGDLQMYDAVLISTNFAPIDPVGLGDVLAEYADNGGGIVEMTFSPDGTFGIGGNFSANYSLWNGTGILTGQRTLGTINDPAHPIVQGVTTFDGGTSSFRLGGTPKNGGVVLAEYDDASAFIVINEDIGPANVKTAFINIYTPSSDARADFWVASTDGALIIKNALDWVSPGGGGGTCVDVTYTAPGLPLDIDPGGDQTIDCVAAPNLYPVTVSGSGTIGVDSNIDNVTITITHTFDGDLDIILVSPAGTELILSDQNGGGGDNFIDTVFMDGGADITTGTPPFTGTFEPEGGTFAATFDGEAITGDWQLKVCDNFAGDTGTVDAYSITICSPALPDNDTCAGAFPVACGDVVVSETITNTDTGGNPAPDEWYSFTGAGTPQVVTLSLCDGGTDYDSFLRVFDACGGTEIAANDDSCGLQSELSFLSDGTTTYYIMVEGFGSNSGNFSLEVTCVDPPPNDECAGAISMNCGDTVVGETDTATFDASAPVCVTGITAPGVWYEFTDTTGLVTNYTLSMCDGGTDYDSKITVYSGDCGSLACVVDNDDTCGLQSEVSWQGDGLTTYYILVHGFGSSTGNFSMALTCAPVPPPNDMIVNSIDVDEIGFPYTDPAVAMPAATTEGGNPAGCNIDGANGVWYNFVPDGDGFATAEIITPGGASAVTFYSAPDENATETDLTLVDWPGNQCVPGTSAIIPTVTGQAYYVFVLNNGAITDIVIDGNNLGVNENAIEGFTYHPNPTDGVLNLNSIDNIDTVAIYNILGQQVLNQTVDATSTALDVSRLTVGAYVMKVSVNGTIGTYKIIKR